MSIYSRLAVSLTLGQRNCVKDVEMAAEFSFTFNFQQTMAKNFCFDFMNL